MVTGLWCSACQTSRSACAVSVHVSMRCICCSRSLSHHPMPSRIIPTINRYHVFTVYNNLPLGNNSLCIVSGLNIASAAWCSSCRQFWSKTENNAKTTCRLECAFVPSVKLQWMRDSQRLTISIAFRYGTFLMHTVVI